MSERKWHSVLRKGDAQFIKADPIVLPRPQGEFVRMKHPSKYGLYYSSVQGAWVKKGWTVWTIREWQDRGFERGFDPATGVDRDGRHWEFFGYTIPLIKAE